MNTSAQNKKQQGIITIIVVFIIVILYLLFGRENHTDGREKNFRHHKIELTAHAKCRMDCRHISEKEIKEVLQKGKINYSKTKKNAAPCPSYAVDYFVNGKQIRIVVGDCDDKAVIITVMDTGKNFECHCPGDE